MAERGPSPVCSNPYISDANSLSAVFYPTQPGMHRLWLTAFDGCHSYSDSVLVDVACGPEPQLSVNSTQFEGQDDWTIALTWLPEVQAFEAAHVVAAVTFPSESMQEYHVPPTLRWSLTKKPQGSDDQLRFFGVNATHLMWSPTAPGEYEITVTAVTGCHTKKTSVWLIAECDEEWEVDAGGNWTVYSTAAHTEDMIGPFPVLDFSNTLSVSGTDFTPSHTWVITSVPEDSDIVSPMPFMDGDLVALDSPGWYEVAVFADDGCYGDSSSTFIHAMCNEPPVAVPWVAGDWVEYETYKGRLRGAILGNSMAAGELLEGFANVTELVEGYDMSQDPEIVHRTNEIVVFVGNELLSEGPAMTIQLNGTLWDKDDAAEDLEGLWEIVYHPDHVESVAGIPCDRDYPEELENLGLDLLCELESRADLDNADEVREATFSFSSLGTYVLALHATDSCSVTSNLLVVRAVCNPSPQADAGYDVALKLGPRNTLKPVHLNGEKSFDPEGEDLWYIWTIVEVPEGSELLSWTEYGMNITFTPDVIGEYIVRLLVTDGCSYSQDLVRITMECNAPPVAEANGRSHVVLFRDNVGFGNVVLDGYYSHDPDGMSDIAYVNWTLVGVHRADQDGIVPVSNVDELVTLINGDPATVRDVTHALLFVYLLLTGVMLSQILFSPPAETLKALPSLQGNQISNFYYFSLSVYDQCTWDVQDVVVETRCPYSPVAVVENKGFSLEWNAVQGSRFAFTEGLSASDFRSCANSASVEEGCAPSIPLLGLDNSTHKANNKITWRVAQQPGWANLDEDAFTNASASVTFLNMETGFDPLHPLATGLGQRFEGDFEVVYRVENPCVASEDSVEFNLKCNSPPVAHAGSDKTITWNLITGFESVSLDGSLSSPSSPGAPSDEPTRYERCCVA